MLTVGEITRFIEQDRTSRKKKKAAEGQRYYEAENDILGFRIFYMNSGGNYVEDTYRANIKIPHAFFPELVDQKVQYMLSGEDDFIQADDPALQKYLDDYFDDDFKAELYELLTFCSVNGFSYFYAYKNAGDRLAFDAVDALSVVEVDGKYTQDGESYVIYHYLEKIDLKNEPVVRIQVWGKEDVTCYTKVGSASPTLDTDKEQNPRPHVLYSEDGQLYASGLGFIPFFRLDNNRKQFSDLKPIKALIDDYDLMSCGLSNNLQDTAETLYVVKGFDGDDVGELIENVKARHHIGVPEGGDVEAVTVTVPYEARQSKLDVDEKNIYKFGMGFNAASVGDGNITNVVIKSRYALLDLKCNKMEIRLKKYLKQIVNLVLDEINDVYETGYTSKDVDIRFKHEIITNETDNAQIELTEAQRQQVEVTTLLNSAPKLDPEIVLQSLCDILDLDYKDIKDKVDLTDATVDLNNASEALALGGTNEQTAEAG